uniref:Uncharacterized protein n=1 Tax=Meloidogyne incognita TaxID=6306 RepID=A0A914LAV3_MELIC
MRFDQFQASKAKRVEHPVQQQDVQEFLIQPSIHAPHQKQLRPLEILTKLDALEERLFSYARKTGPVRKKNITLDNSLSHSIILTFRKQPGFSSFCLNMSVSLGKMAGRLQLDTNE